jgi:molecular chaperone GrpE
MVKDQHKRTTDPAAMGAGDSQLDLSPPNVEEVQPVSTSAGAQEPTVASTPQSPGAAQTAGAPAGGADGAAAEAGTSMAALQDESNALRRELQEVTDRHLRLAAEFNNYRKRMERERSELWARAQADIGARLLDTLDDLERVAHHSENATAQTLHEGVQLIERKLRAALMAAGLEEVEAENASFDPRVMEAVAVVSAESPKDDDVVSDVFQRGYRFKGQLLRAAKVRVRKHE